MGWIPRLWWHVPFVGNPHDCWVKNPGFPLDTPFWLCWNPNLKKNRKNNKKNCENLICSKLWICWLPICSGLFLFISPGFIPSPPTFCTSSATKTHRRCSSCKLACFLRPKMRRKSATSVYVCISIVSFMCLYYQFSYISIYKYMYECVCSYLSIDPSIFPSVDWYLALSPYLYCRSIAASTSTSILFIFIFT